MNSIITETLEKKENYAKVKCSIEWITPMRAFHTEEIHEVVKNGWKWYIKHIPLNNYIPADQFSEIPTNNFIQSGQKKDYHRGNFP